MLLLHDLERFLGNRTSSSESSRASTYTANSLNQYTSRSVPGYADIIGEAKAGATVTVNTEATTCQGGYYYKELEADNSTQPRWLSANVKAVLGVDEAERTGHLYLPKTPEVYSYDKDGNLLSDGRWTYQWDGENRLIGMDTQLNAALGGAPRQRLTFGYDYQSHRISKKVEDWKGGHYQERFTMLYVYDGWNLVAECLQTGPKIRTYVWGSDLSGGTAAGGIGGLLFINQYPEDKTYSVGYDGNGNVMALFDMATDGTLAASYEYGPFGEALKVNGLMASINPFRFSTKYTDNESGLVYYGYRFYSPDLGRWINRDPIGENGGVNILSFSKNSPIGVIDYMGLLTAESAFYQLYRHWAAANGKDAFIRTNGEWGEFVKRHESAGAISVSMRTRESYDVLAKSILKNHPKHPNYRVDDISYTVGVATVYFRDGGLKFMLNASRHRFKGKYKVNDDCSVTFYGNIHYVEDDIDANFDYWSDYILEAGRIFHENFRPPSGPLSPPRFQYFFFSVEFNAPDVTIKIDKNGIPVRTERVWPWGN